MPRKIGDRNYATYVSYKNFISNKPVHQINNTPWYLKYENKKPAFFLKGGNVFKQMPNVCFKWTAERSDSFDMTGYQLQVKQFLDLTMEEILLNEYR